MLVPYEGGWGTPASTPLTSTWPWTWKPSARHWRKPNRCLKGDDGRESGSATAT